MNTRRLTTVTLLMLALVPATLASATMTGNVSPSETDHGVPETTFLKFWSNDVDSDESIGDIDVEDNSDGLRQLMNATDWTFDTPPTQNVNKWNTGDHKDFQHGGENSSIHPANTKLSHRWFIEDAYTRIFTVSPSIQTYDPDGESTRFIHPNGTVRGVLDYRIDVPDDSSNDPFVTTWSLKSDKVSNVTLYVDDEPVDRVSETHTPTLKYADIEHATNVTVEATITATLEKKVSERKERCSGSGLDRSCERYWDNSTEDITEDITVTDSKDVTLEEIDASGKFIQRPTDTGFKTGYDIEMSTPWSRIELPDGTTITSPWRYYTASESEWAEFTTRTETRITTKNSSVRPVNIYAFPSDYGYDVESRDATKQYETATQKYAPDLPSNIDVSVATGQYKNIDRLVVETPGNSSGSPTITGLLSGTTVEPELDEKAVRQTNLTLTTVEINPATVNVTAQITDAETGDAITHGTLTVGDVETPVDSNGEATVTVDRPPVSVGVAYNPKPWWEKDTDVAYTSATASVSMSGDLPEFETLTRIAVATLLWLVPMGLTIYALNLISDGAIYDRGDN